LISILKKYLPKSDNSPQDIQITRHMPTDPVFFNAFAGDTNMPDPTEKKTTYYYDLKLSKVVNKRIFIVTTHLTLRWLWDRLRWINLVPDVILRFSVSMSFLFPGCIYII